VIRADTVRDEEDEQAKKHTRDQTLPQAAAAAFVRAESALVVALAAASTFRFFVCFFHWVFHGSSFEFYFLKTV
jgi:hypothetical protein